jgi:nickel-type superoxide dismutase maturation protease
MILATDPTPPLAVQRGEVVAVRLPWFAAIVRGPSMAPTLRSGDAVLVRRSARARTGEVVVGRFRARPDLAVVKRVARAEADGWWLLGDNTYVADDSRAFGVADVLGRVVFRYWPRPRLIRRMEHTR